MNPPREDGAGREDGVSTAPPPSPSPRVRLEVELLDAEHTADAPANQRTPTPDDGAVPDGHTRLTVLVVAAEADVRSYVRECLRERHDFRLVEAATFDAALRLTASCVPAFVIVDQPERRFLATQSHARAIVIVDEVPREPPARDARVRLLARPFTAERMLAEVDQLLD